MKVAQITDK